MFLVLLNTRCVYKIIIMILFWAYDRVSQKFYTGIIFSWLTKKLIKDFCFYDITNWTKNLSKREIY